MTHLVPALEVLLALATAPAVSGRFVMFGDSLSDDGHGANPVVNSALSTDQIDVGIYPPAPYYKGRFSNGPTWIENAAGALGQELINLATGNAASGAVPGAFTVLPYFGYVQTATMVPVPSSLNQATSYAAQHANNVNANDFYLVFIGSNDLVYTVNGVANATNAGIVQYINMTMNAVYNAGARKFVIVNLPPLQLLPMFSPPFVSATASSNAQTYLQNNIPQVNSMIASLVATYPTQHPGATVMTFDSYSFFMNASSNAAEYGFTTTAPCYMGPSFFADITGEYNYTTCAQPANHIFWDNVHPTKAFHSVWGKAFVAALGEQLTANSAAVEEAY